MPQKKKENSIEFQYTTGHSAVYNADNGTYLSSCRRCKHRLFILSNFSFYFARNSSFFSPVSLLDYLEVCSERNAIN